MSFLLRVPQLTKSSLGGYGMFDTRDSLNPQSEAFAKSDTLRRKAIVYDTVPGSPF